MLDAAEAVIDEKGLADAGMAEIARRAGVAVGTLYNYFTDRDGLVHALLDTRRAALGPAIKKIADDASTGRFEARLTRFVHDLLALFDEHRRFVRLGFEIDPPLANRGRNRAVVETLRACILDLLLAGVAEGVIGEENVPLRARFLGAAIKMVLLHELEQGRPFVAETDAIVELFLHGARKRS